MRRAARRLVDGGASAYADRGQNVKQAQKIVVEQLREAGA
jgi:hypothetical protein